MARPAKQTVDYFPHFAISGKTMFILENKFGNDGYAFWFKLLELLACTEGHCFRVENVTDWEFLIAKTKVPEMKAHEILNTLADVNAIDKVLYENKMIWSQNFVDNLSVVYKKRTVTAPEKPDYDSFRDGNIESDEVSGVNNPQSKVKESKVNKSKEKESNERVVVVTEVGDKETNIFYQFEALGFGVLNPYFQGELEEMERKYSAAWTIEAMQKAVEQGKYTLSYAKGILKSWKSNGKDAPKPKYSKGKEVKYDFIEREYDYSDLEKKLLGR